jgi:hypothetical protein|tara:strand:- start:2133 stop:2402 length:270 start_codon:yes stop_codon:yes gene_type:complete
MEKQLINVVQYHSVMNKWMIVRANSTIDYKDGNGQVVKKLFGTRDKALSYIKENYRSTVHKFYPKTFYFNKNGQGLRPFNWHSPSAYNL